MKLANKFFLLLFMVGVVLSCTRDGIDPISQVDPGPDQSAPEVTITFPLDGAVIQVLEEITTINIRFEATDDIELVRVDIDFDGTKIASFEDFLDYRRFVGSYDYDQVTDGTHTITVTATDLDGKSGSATVTFTKEPAYTEVYDGEVLYMPFDGDFIDLVSITQPTVVGGPGFAGEAVGGLDSYKGVENGYLTFPTAGLNLGDEFSAVFWMKVNATPDRAGVLVIGPPDAANPEAQNNRTSGFRFFRENAGGEQRFKLNVGRGDGDSWFDGGDNADVIPDTDDWHHFAFTISGSQCVVYIDGEVASQNAFTGVDWTGCDILSIMSGAPRFTGWNHLSDRSYMDELRIFNKELSQGDIQTIIANEGGAVGYTPKYDGETLYMGFDDGVFTNLVSNTQATVVGTPGFAGEGKVGGNAYAGAADSYLTFPIDGLATSEFSAVFWMKVNAMPDRAGILVIGPEDVDNPGAENLRTSGFRFFRENAGGMQRFKLNAANGTADSWFDGGTDADVDPTTGEWVHFAFTIAGDECVVYIDGEVASQGAFGGIDWTGCDVLSIMSGAPHFTGWDHWSDESLMDELRLFNKALTMEEVNQIITDEM